MNKHILIYQNDEVCIYYMLKEKTFRIIDKKFRKPPKKIDFGITFLAITIFNVIAQSDVFHHMSQLLSIMMLFLSIFLGVFFGIKASNSQNEELLNAKEITLTKEDVVLCSDSIERYWDGIITVGITSVIIVSGVFIAYFKQNILFYSVECFLISLFSYVFIYVNPIYIFKLIRFVRKEKREKR